MSVPPSPATNSPHLGAIQPTWRDLPFACEVVKTIYENRNDDYDKIRHDFIEVSGKSKIDQMNNFLEKVGVIDSADELLPNGVFLAEVYSPASQETLGESIQPGVKTDLAPAEQTFWRTLLFERNWTPMLATLNIVATCVVSTQETESRAEAFQERCNHLDKYQSFESINTWKKKSQTHFGWLEKTGIARKDERDHLELTESGKRLHEQIRDHYHSDWPGAIRE